VAEALGLVEQVGAEQNAASFFRLLADQVMEHARGVRIEAVGRFVEDEKLGLVEQRGDDRELLFHALRVVHRELLEVVLEFEALDESFAAFFGGPVVFETAHAGDEVEHLAAAQVVVENRLVRQIADVAHDLGSLRKAVVVENPRGSGGRFEDAHQHADRRRLARTVGSEQREPLPPPDFEIDLRNRGEVPIVLGEALQRGGGGIAFHGEAPHATPWLR